MKFGVYKVKYLFADNTYLAPDSKMVDDFIGDREIPETVFDQLGDMQRIGEVEIESLLEELSKEPFTLNPKMLQIFLPGELQGNSSEKLAS